MKRLLLLLSVLALASCKDQGPHGLDPIVLAKNEQSGVQPVVITWYDQSGQVKADTVPPLATRCYHFTSTLESDSVRFTIAFGDPADTHVYQLQVSPWFDPRTGLVSPDPNAPSAYPDGAEYWTLTIGPSGAAMKAVAEPPC